mmetsp:Transcript_9353/g.26732  ORF Transcript_9353/g.26732 Transcript_9353/m.26732 type:complete len:257 (-) Transcript_9353:129-899(-)
MSNSPPHQQTIDSTSSNAANSAKTNSICWSCISRNDVILVEAGDDHFDGAVVETAKKLMSKKATPGWEFATGPRGGSKLKAVKLHIYEYDDASPKDDPALNVWSYCSVYNPQTTELPQVQSFLEKMASLTEYFRFEDEAWKYGDTLAAQDTFAPVLKQRMDEVTYYGKMAMLNEEIEHAKEIMARNIELILARDEKLESIQEKTTRLQEMAGVFKKNAKNVKRRMLWQNAKHGLVMGTAITAGVAVVVVPPLVAIL